MNTQIINAELALALRKCLPFVRRHAIISGGDGSLTYAFAVRALADADAQQQEEQRVKNIVTAEQQRAAWLMLFDRFGVRGVVHNLKVDGRVVVRGSLQAADPYRATTTEVLRRQSPSTISGQDAKNEAARAVRPGEGYLPAAPPAKGCDCDTCTKFRRGQFDAEDFR